MSFASYCWYSSRRVVMTIQHHKQVVALWRGANTVMGAREAELRCCCSPISTISQCPHFESFWLYFVFPAGLPFVHHSSFCHLQAPMCL